MSTRTTARAAAKPAAETVVEEPKARPKRKRATPAPVAELQAAPAAKPVRPRAPKPAAAAVSLPAPVLSATGDKFHDALSRVLQHEGGRVDDPRDPGGRTNKGITQRVYSAWRARNSLPVRDVFEISDNEVEAIYRFQYWQPIHGDALPVGVGYVVFDGAVNSGPKQSVKWLQRALGDAYSGAVDGSLGAVTLQAVEANGDNDALIAAICERRMVFLQALKSWPTFRKGWTARVQDVMATGQAWASGSVAPPAEYRAGGQQKAEVTNAKAAPARAPGDAVAGGGIAGVGGALTIGSWIDKAKEQLWGYADQFEWVGHLMLLLTILGGLVFVAGFAYRWWATRERTKLDDALDREVAK